MLYPMTGWMLFDDTDLFQPPAIHSSGNGWVYKPDEARTPHEIKRGLNKAWPRERYNNSEKPNEWLSNFVQSGIEARGWKLPTKIERPALSQPLISGNVFMVTWFDDLWGWQGISLEINDGRSRYYNNQGMSATYRLHLHSATEWWRKQRVESGSNGNGRGLTTNSNGIKIDNREDMRVLAARWVADPWNETAKHFEGYYELIRPPVEEMQNLDYPKEREDNDDHNVHAFTSGNAAFWLRGTIDQVMTKDVAWKALQQLVEAFKFTGYEVRVDTNYTYANDGQEITGIKIEIPTDINNVKSRHTDHSFHITPEGITVECGFVDEEKRWIERETRMARDHMALLEKDLFTDYDIEL